MTTSAARTSDDLQAVLGARRELGGEYDRALVESFVERAEAHLLSRLPAAAGGLTPVPSSVARAAPATSATVEVGAGGFALALATVAWGLLATFLAVVGGSGRDPLVGLAVVAGWSVVGLCDLVYVAAALGRRHRRAG